MWYDINSFTFIGFVIMYKVLCLTVEPEVKLFKFNFIHGESYGGWFLWSCNEVHLLNVCSISVILLTNEDHELKADDIYMFV